MRAGPAFFAGAAAGGGALPGAVPTVAYAVLSSDVSTSSTSFVSLLSTSITVAGTSDKVDIVASVGWDNQTSGNSPSFQITVDGTDEGQSFSTSNNIGGAGSTFCIAQVTGLAAGSHTVALNWKSSNGNAVRIRPVSTAGAYHAAIVARIANSSVYSALSGSFSSSASTPTDTLISSVSFTSTAATSALYIRFSACGQSGSAACLPLFQIYVDGVAQNAGCSDMGDGTGQRFNAGIVTVIPVTAGAHTVAVKWGGGGGTATIDTSTAQNHARLYVDEVYTATDAGSTLPRPQFKQQTADAGAVTATTFGSVSVVPAATTLYFIEATASGSNGASGNVGMKLTIDGTSVAGATTLGSNAGRDSLAITNVQSLAAGSHTIALVGTSGTFNPATNPDRHHASLVVWEVTT